MTTVSLTPRERAQLFRRAVIYLADRCGEGAVLKAFGDPDPINRGWELPAEEYKEFLRERMRVALKVSRGAA